MGAVLEARDLARPEFKANPYPFYARLRAEEPVCRISAPFIKAWLVTRYDDAVTVLRDPRISKDIGAKLRYIPRFARPLTDHMLGRDPPDHTRLRSLVSKAFTPRRIEEMRDEVQTVSDALLSAARPGEPFDLVRDYALPLPLTVISRMLGIPERTKGVPRSRRPRHHAGSQSPSRSRAGHALLPRRASCEDGGTDRLDRALHALPGDAAREAGRVLALADLLPLRGLEALPVSV